MSDRFQSIQIGTLKRLRGWSFALIRDRVCGFVFLGRIVTSGPRGTTYVESCPLPVVPQTGILFPLQVSASSQSHELLRNKDYEHVSSKLSQGVREVSPIHRENMKR